MSAPLLVLHAFGDPEGGAAWRAALDRGSWPADWRAPDLPGHGEAPMPVGGFYELTDPAIAGLRTILDARWDDAPVIVAVGPSAIGGELVALGGRAGRLVLVDGLGGPWPASADAAIAAQYAWLRAVAADTAVGQPDPRIAHGYPDATERQPVARYRAAIHVPVVAIETPSSPTPAAEIEDRLAMFGGPTDVVRIDRVAPDAVLGAVREWCGAGLA